MAFGDPSVMQEKVQPERLPYVGASYLSDHAAIAKQGAGVTPGELASFTESFGDYARTRIMGTGASEYSDTAGQKYETMTFNELLIELADELADVSNYSAMLATKVLALWGALDEQ